MKKYLVAAALIVAFATPTLAADYYVALRLGGGAAKCEVMTIEPDTKTYKPQRPTPRQPWPRCRSASTATDPAMI